VIRLEVVLKNAWGSPASPAVERQLKREQPAAIYHDAEGNVGFLEDVLS
jgi:hypothetical protein